MSICNIEISEYVSKEKTQQYYDLVKSCNGKILHKPFYMKISTHFTVGFDNNDDYIRFTDTWYQLKTNIIEVDNRSYFKTKLNNLKFLTKNIFRG